MFNTSVAQQPVSAEPSNLTKLYLGRIQPIAIMSRQFNNPHVSKNPIVTEPTCIDHRRSHLFI